MKSEITVAVVAGDPSGDAHAAPVLRNLFSKIPGLNAFGIGGPNMTRCGFEQVMPFEPFNRMGFVEVAIHLPFFLRAKAQLIQLLEQRKPRLLICVDYPGFNIPLMKKARSMGIPVLWYIAPMVWAWKKDRAAVMGNFASHIAVIFPFEKEFFIPFTSKVSYVGNPSVESFLDKEAARAGDEDTPGSRSDIPTLLLAPGSRVQEIRHILGAMTDAYCILRKGIPDLHCIVSQCGSVPRSLYETACANTGIEISEAPLSHLLQGATAALVTSGTATLETALTGVPMVVAYKTSRVNYFIMKRLVKLSNISLPNIISGESIVTECIQGKATGENLAREAAPLLIHNSAQRNRIEMNYTKLRHTLGNSRPSVNVADIAMSLLQMQT